MQFQFSLSSHGHTAKDDLEVWMSFQKHRTVPPFPGHAGGTARSWPNSRPAGGMCKLSFSFGTHFCYFSPNGVGPYCSLVICHTKNPLSMIKPWGLVYFKHVWGGGKFDREGGGGALGLIWEEGLALCRVCKAVTVSFLEIERSVFRFQIYSRTSMCDNLS